MVDVTLEQLRTYVKEAEQELEAILQYWMRHTVDEAYGGFVGRIDGSNVIHPQAPKGAVLNSRILWTFSASYAHTKNAAYLNIATRAYSYLVQHFIDPQYGGVYWSVDYKGR